MLLKLAALSAVGYAGYRYFTRKAHTSHPAFAQGQASGQHSDVRDAGPEAMRDQVEGAWSDTDERIDESFPASDPPGNY